MPPSPTHYIPAFCRTRGVGRYVQEQAACNEWVDPSEHTVEPKCSACRAYVEAEAETAAELAEKWDAEESLIDHALANAGRKSSDAHH